MGSSLYKRKSQDDITPEFKIFDQDNNGSISADEVFEVMKKFCGNLTKKEVVELVKLVDKDGNG
jgi:Ca2+-binding EF-hand superfamily protein